MKQLASPKVRSYFYRIVIIVLAILGAKGYIDNQMTMMLGSLSAAVLAISVADYHVPRGLDASEPKEEKYTPRHKAQ
jgi:hypothetical protein